MFKVKAPLSRAQLVLQPLYIASFSFLVCVCDHEANSHPLGVLCGGTQLGHPSPKNIENVSHFHVIQSNVYYALCEAFPFTEVTRKPFISDSAFKLICEASDLKKRKPVFLTF